MRPGAHPLRRPIPPKKNRQRSRGPDSVLEEDELAVFPAEQARTRTNLVDLPVFQRLHIGTGAEKKQHTPSQREDWEAANWLVCHLSHLLRRVVVKAGLPR